MRGTGVPRGVLAAVLLGTLVAPLNTSMIAVALVSIQRDLDASPADTSWVVMAFYVAGAVAQPAMGRLSDAIGPRRILCAGWVAVGAVGVLAPFAPSAGWLVLARAGLALGSSAAYPAGLSVLRRAAGGGAAASAAIGAITGVAALSAACGPAVGGVLTDAWGWEAVFAVNGLLAVFGLTLARLFVPPDPGNAGPDLGAGPAAAPLPSGGAATLRGLAPVYVLFACVNAVFLAAFILLPQWLEQTRGLSPSQAGLVLLMVAAAGLVCTPVATRAVRRFGAGRTAFAGIASLCGSACVLLGVLHDGTPVAAIVGAAMLLGVPFAFNNIGFQAVVVERADPRVLGLVAGVLQTSRFVGCIVATVIVASAVTTTATSDAAQRVALVGVILTCCALALAATQWRRPAAA